MAEFCMDCWNRLNNQKKPRAAYILSSELEICEECGEWKQTIVAERISYKLVCALLKRMRKEKN